MNQRRSVPTVLFLAAAVVAACGGDDDASPAATDAPAVTDAPAAADATAASGAADEEVSAGLQLVSTELGDVIADADGRILYLFVPDAQGESTCYEACEATWPVVPELSSVGDGLDPALLGTTTRTNGTNQATYNDWPLYYYAGDTTPGETNGQGLNDVWFVIDSAGDAAS